LIGDKRDILKRVWEETYLKKETFEKAEKLNRDISNFDNQISDLEKNSYSVKIETAFSDCLYSDNFAEDLLEFMKQKREEYVKEFDELEG
jgi:hypothetical protein